MLPTSRCTGLQRQPARVYARQAGLDDRCGTISAVGRPDIESNPAPGSANGMIRDHLCPGTHTMTADMLVETVALLEDLSRRAAELAAALPSLELGAEDLAMLARDVQRINGRLADAEERVAVAGPGVDW